MLTGLLSTVAGAGAGSIGSGIVSANAANAGIGASMSTGQLAHSVFDPSTMGPVISPHVSSGMIGVHPGITGDGGLPGIWNPGTSVPANEFVTAPAPYNASSSFVMPQKMSAAQGTRQAWNRTWSDPKFQQAMGAQVIDGIFAEPPRKQPIGGGGGGGSGSMAPAYSASGSGKGQYEMIQSFPERRTSIQWNEVA